MRIESSVTAISWIPSEAVKGLPKLPFTMGVAHYDDPPPDVIEDLDAMREADAFREANELRAYIEVADDGSITDAGHLGTRSPRRDADQGRPEGTERGRRRAAHDPGRARDRRRLGALQADGGRTHGCPGATTRARQAVHADQLGDRLDDARAHDQGRRLVRARSWPERARSRATGSTTRTGSSSRNRGRSTSSSGTGSRTARTRRGAARRPRRS